MINFGGSPTRYDYEWVGTDRSNVAVEPVNSRTPTGLIFGALEGLGYPVETVCPSMFIDLPSGYANEVRSSGLPNYEDRLWTRYVSYVKDFTPAAEAVVASIDPSVNRVPLNRHPFRLYSEIQSGNLPLLAGLVEEVKLAGDVGAYDSGHDSEVLTESFIYGCFSQAFRNYFDSRKTQGPVQPSTTDRYWLKLHQELRVEGAPRYTNFAVAAEDYVLLYERHDPDMVAFRQPKT